jgi:hypothetical protein
MGEKLQLQTLYDEELEKLDSKEYAYRVIGNKGFLGDNPQYLGIELQRRTLHSQTPRWVNYLVLILTAIILLLTAYATFR